jgi:hypothetical protein
MLKLNQDKTELIVFAPKHLVKEFSECCLSFDETIVTNASFPVIKWFYYKVHLGDIGITRI